MIFKGSKVSIMPLTHPKVARPSRNRGRYLSLPPTRQNLTQDQKPESQLKWGYWGGKGRERAETRTLLVIDPLSAMWVWWVRQYHGPKSRSGHVCQNIAWTRPWGLMLYKGCIGVKKAARPPEGDPTETGGFSTSSVPLSIDSPSVFLCPVVGRSRPAVIACRTVRSGVFHHWIHYLWPQGAVPPGFNPLRRGWVYRPAPEAPRKGECRRGPRHFWNCPSRWPSALRRDPP